MRPKLLVYIHANYTLSHHTSYCFCSIRRSCPEKLFLTSTPSWALRPESLDTAPPSLPPMLHAAGPSCSWWPRQRSSTRAGLCGPTFEARPGLPGLKRDTSLRVAWPENPPTIPINILNSPRSTNTRSIVTTTTTTTTTTETTPQSPSSYLWRNMRRNRQTPATTMSRR